MHRISVSLAVCLSIFTAQNLSAIERLDEDSLSKAATTRSYDDVCPHGLTYESFKQRIDEKQKDWSSVSNDAIQRYSSLKTAPEFAQPLTLRLNRPTDATITGLVLVEVVTNEYGVVKHVETLHSSHLGLGEAITEAIYQSRFVPTGSVERFGKAFRFQAERHACVQ